MDILYKNSNEIQSETDEEIRDPCPICLEDLVKSCFFWKNQAVGLQHCNHFLCKKCYKTLNTEYRDLARKCPLCRTVLESTIEWLGNLALTIIFFCLLGLLLIAIIPAVAYLEILMFLGFAIFFFTCLVIYAIDSVFKIFQDIKRAFDQLNLWTFIFGFLGGLLVATVPPAPYLTIAIVLGFPILLLTCILGIYILNYYIYEASQDIRLIFDDQFL